MSMLDENVAVGRGGQWHDYRRDNEQHASVMASSRCRAFKAPCVLPLFNGIWIAPVCFCDVRVKERASLHLDSRTQWFR